MQYIYTESDRQNSFYFYDKKNRLIQVMKMGHNLNEVVYHFFRCKEKDLNLKRVGATKEQQWVCDCFNAFGYKTQQLTVVMNVESHVLQGIKPDVPKNRLYAQNVKADYYMYDNWNAVFSPVYVEISDKQVPMPRFESLEKAKKVISKETVSRMETLLEAKHFFSNISSLVVKIA